MKIKTIQVENYGTFFGAHSFQLDGRGLVLVLGHNLDEPRMNSNGSGKSTLFDALDWCLFGVIPRNDHADSVVNEEAGKDCKVTVDLVDDDGAKITVIRHRKVKGKHGVAVIVNGEDISALDTKETQNTIDRLLGVDRETFHAAVLFAQTDLWNFADASDKERVDILTKILQLHQIDEWLDMAKERRRENEGKTQRAQSLVNSVEGKLAALQDTDYAAQIEAWEVQQSDKLHRLNFDLDAERIQMESKRHQAEGITAAQADVAGLQSTAPQPPDTSALRQEMNHLWQEHSGKQADAKVAQSNGAQAKRDLDKIQRLGVGNCSQCGQPITAEHLAAEAAKLQPTIDGANQVYQQHVLEAQGIKDRIDGIDAQIKAMEAQFAGESQAFQARLQTAQTVLARCQAAQRDLEASQASVGRLERLLEAERQAQNPYRGQAEALEAQKAQAQAELATAQQQLAGLQEADAYFGFWVDAFGPKGLKSYIIDSKLEEMTNAANQWVQLLTGGTVWIRFETQTLGRSSKTLSNKMNIRVFRWNPNGTISERNYRSWSGGEKQRVSLGVDLGLARLIAARASKRYDTLIFDEVFRHLDQSGREAVVEVLHQLKREKTSLFVIDHDTEFQGAFENRVWVQKQGGRSTIIEESGHVQANTYQAATTQERSQLSAPEAKPKATRKRGGVPAGAPARRKRKRRPTVQE